MISGAPLAAPLPDAGFRGARPPGLARAGRRPASGSACRCPRAASRDRPGARLRSALREVVARFGLDPVLTPQQDVLLSNVAPADRAALEALLRAHGVTPAGGADPARPLDARLPGAADLRAGAD